MQTTMRVRIWLFVCLLLALVPGCTSEDALGLKIDLSQLNWQTGALILLAYMAKSDKHFAGLAAMVQNLLRSLRILPQPDDPKSLTAEQIAKLLADLFVQLKGQPLLQARVLDMMQAAANGTDLNPEVVTNAGK